MPEITEVLIMSHYLFTKLKNRYISDIDILSGRYINNTIEGLSDFKLNLPAKIKNIETKGKLLWFVLENSIKETVYLLCNFGLTGEWSFINNNPRIKFKITNKDKKYNLYFSDARNFGIIMFTKDKEVFNERINKLARDYIKEPFSDMEYYNEINKFIKEKPKNKDKLLIKFLMDQNKGDTVGSGIGNYIAAETLYCAKLSPHRTIGSLTKEEIIELNQSIKKIIKSCYINNKTDYNNMKYIEQHKEQIKNGKFPDYLPEIKFEDFNFNVYRKKLDNKGNKVKPENIITGRTTYWVPAIQK